MQHGGIDPSLKKADSVVRVFLYFCTISHVVMVLSALLTR